MWFSPPRKIILTCYLYTVDHFQIRLLIDCKVHVHCTAVNSACSYTCSLPVGHLLCSHTKQVWVAQTVQIDWNVYSDQPNPYTQHTICSCLQILYLQVVKHYWWWKICSSGTCTCIHVPLFCLTNLNQSPTAEKQTPENNYVNVLKNVTKLELADKDCFREGTTLAFGYIHLNLYKKLYHTYMYILYNLWIMIMLLF